MCSCVLVLLARQSSNCTLNNQEMCVRNPYLRHSSDLVGRENGIKIAPNYKLCPTLLGLIQSFFLRISKLTSIILWNYPPLVVWINVQMLFQDC